MSKQDPPTATPPTSPTTFLDAVAHRRSVYALNASSPVPDSTVTELLNRVMRNVPSSFNTQSARTALLLGAEHKLFWDGVVLSAVDADAEKTGDAAHAERVKKRLPGFVKAHGTILFFEAESTVNKLMEDVKAYAELVPGWSEHSSGMHQFAMWTALEAAGFGANLQHYNFVPGVEARVQEQWGLPKDWRLKAQLVFGGVEEGAWPKEGKDKISTDETARVFGSS